MCDERKNTDLFKEGIKMSSRKELLTNCGHFSEKLYETRNEFENTLTYKHSCLEFLSDIQLRNMKQEIHNKTCKDKRWILSENRITYGPQCINCGCKKNISGDGDIYCRCDTCSKKGCKYDKGITLPDISKKLSELEDISLQRNLILETILLSMNGKQISILRSVSKTFYVLLHINEKVLDLIWNERSSELLYSPVIVCSDFKIKENCKCCHCGSPDEQG